MIIGLLVALVLVVIYIFFEFTYISVFCFGSAFISFYLFAMIFWKARQPLHDLDWQKMQRC